MRVGHGGNCEGNDGVEVNQANVDGHGNTGREYGWKDEAKSDGGESWVDNE